MLGEKGQNGGAFLCCTLALPCLPACLFVCLDDPFFSDSDRLGRLFIMNILLSSLFNYHHGIVTA